MKLTQKQNQIFCFLISCVFTSIIFIENIEPLKILDIYYVKHIIVLAAILIMGAFLGVHMSRGNLEKKLKIPKEIQILFLMSILLFAISLYRMLLAGTFRWYVLKQLYFLLTPIIFIGFIKLMGKNNFKLFVNVVFISTTLAFIIRYASMGQLNINSFLAAFNIKNTLLISETKLESNLGQYFFLCFFVYLYDKNYTRSLLSAVLVIYCAKRFSIIFVFLAIIFLCLFNRKRKIDRRNYCILSIVIILFFTLITLVLYNLYLNPSFEQWFYSKTGLELTKFTMSRNEIFDLVMTKSDDFIGLGSVTNILEIYNKKGMTNLHNDLLMVYLDCGIIGLLILIICFVKIFKINKYTIFIGLFVFLEMFSAHFLGSGGLIFFSVSYLVYEYFLEKSEEKNFKILPIVFINKNEAEDYEKHNQKKLYF